MKFISAKGLLLLSVFSVFFRAQGFATYHEDILFADSARGSISDSVLHETQDIPQFQFRIYADINYAFDRNHPRDHYRPFGSNPMHVDQFDIGYSFVEFTYKSKHFRTTAAFNAGGVVDKMYENEPEMLKRIRELSGEYYFKKGLSLEAGIMPAFYGFEGFINKENWFVSRAVMTDFAPDFDLGARLHYRTKTPWRFILQVANGWQTLRETNSHKAVGALIRYEKKTHFINWGLMRTNESKVDSLDLTRYYSNFFMQFNIGEKFKIAPLWDFGIQKDSLNSQQFNFWTSACLNLRYEWNKYLATSLRGEMFYDPHQIIPEVHTGTVHGFQYYGGSLGIDYMFNEHAWLRFETRYAHSRDEVYSDFNENLHVDDLIFILSMQIDIHSKLNLNKHMLH